MRPVPAHYLTVFSVAADRQSPAFIFEHAWVPKLLDVALRRRDAIDGPPRYRGASYGARYNEGHSYFNLRTVKGLTYAFTLSFSDVEDDGRRLSPSALTADHVVDLARWMKRMAPALVMCEDSLAQQVGHPSRPNPGTYAAEIIQIAVS
ncbi:MAG: hypothetical protein P4M15_02610 [Alphaproteobacteria bacterium]|nr:hypothetical protein [Alphaproteobacteria bacterium]